MIAFLDLVLILCPETSFHKEFYSSTINKRHREQPELDIE